MRSGDGPGAGVTGAGRESREAAGPLRVSVLQTAPVLLDEAANARHLLDLTARTTADVFLTPELSLTGYDVGDAVHRLARPLDRGIPELAGATSTLIVGCIEAAPEGPCNTAIAVRGGNIDFRHRKLYLPTYGMFDEARWFGAGSSLETWSPAPGWNAGVLICEDFWHPGLAYVLASRGIHVLFVQAAAPGRGVWEGGAAGRFASADVWERIARTTAQLYGIYVALANRVGVEGGVTFAGGSLIAGPDGDVLARADDAGEGILEAELTHAAVQRARRPYAHGRDDDVRLVLRELERTVQP